MSFMSNFKIHPAAPPKSLGGYKIAGQARDGVWIIKPSLRPTSFSRAEAAASVEKVLGARRNGKADMNRSK